MKQIIIALAVLLVFPITTFSQDLKGIDEITSFSEGLAAVRKGNQWGFINEEGTLVIDFRNDLHWNTDADTSKSDVRGIRFPKFIEGRCLITELVEDGVTLYGFIDAKGNTLIKPEFLNVHTFKDGYSTGVLFDKTLRGKNEFNLDIYEFKFFDVLLDTSGNIVEYFDRRFNIQMTKRRYELPTIDVKRLSDGLISVRTKEQKWEIRKLILDN